MNKKVIKKYRDVFDWWLDGGSVWCKDNDKWQLADVIGWFSNVIYVQNDQYAEFRKAQADGKVIQCNIIEGQSEQEHYAYKDSQWYAVENFKYASSHYRIKPDEPKFKVGDWAIGTEDHKIYQVTRRDINCAYLKKWEPQEGDWVCFPVYVDGIEERYIVSKYTNNYCRHKGLAPLEFLQTLGD